MVWIQCTVEKMRQNYIYTLTVIVIDFPHSSDSRESIYNTGHPGLISGLGRSLGEGNGNPLQYSCLESSKDRGAYRLQSMGSQRVGHDWSNSTFISLSNCNHIKINVEKLWVISFLCFLNFQSRYYTIFVTFPRCVWVCTGGLSRFPG